MLGQQLQIVERPQPFGEQGIRSSLEEVAKGGWRARNHPKVRAWAIEQLVRHEKETGQKVRTPRKRAEVLLGAVQKKLWVPDSVGSEWMAGGHLMACDASTKDEVCFLGGDCDDLSRLLLGSFLGVGLDAVVVGHAYNEAGNIGHVLTAVKVDGAWHYADPSTALPLGEVVKFTRERVLEPAGATTICDKHGGSCLGRLGDVRVEDYLQQGTFVGVDGVLFRRRLVWLGQDKSYVEKIYDQCTGGGNVSTGKEELKGYAKCAADAYCATYGVPPGVCGAVAGKVIAAIEDALSNAGPGASPSFLRVYVLRTVHDRLFPSERKWNASDAHTWWGKDNVQVGNDPSEKSRVYVPRQLYELVKRYGYDLHTERAAELMRGIGQSLQVQRPSWYAAEQKRLLVAGAKAENELVERAAKSSKSTIPAEPSSSSAAPIVVGALAVGALVWLLV